MSTQRQKSPIKEFLLLSALWLPLGFFLWFKIAGLLVYPVARIVAAFLALAWGEDFHSVFQTGYLLEINTNIPLDQLHEGRRVALVWDINPMIYGYGIPLLFGLVMATPVNIRQRLTQLGIGFAILWLMQSWGVFWEAQRDLEFEFLGVAAAGAGVVPFPATLVALCYQLGYLILPAVVPVASWILMNRQFIENLVYQGTKEQ